MNLLIRGLRQAPGPRPSPGLALVALLAAVSAGTAWGEVKVSNPGLADRETLAYAETIGAGPARPFGASLTLVGSGPSARYEYRTKGADLESVYRLDPATLLSLSSETLTRTPDSTVRRTADYQDVRPSPGASDLPVTDNGSLPIVLRGYPWGQQASARILYLGNPASSGSGVTFEFQVLGREKIEAAGRTWDCWHASLGLGGALSFVLAKSEFWFAAEGTHPMVKFSGPAGGPGSPNRTLVLQSYGTGR